MRVDQLEASCSMRPYRKEPHTQLMRPAALKSILQWLTVAFLLLMFLAPVQQSGGPEMYNTSGASSSVNQDRTSLPASGGFAHSGTGTARDVTFKGQVVNETAPVLYLDSATSGYASITSPSGWMGEQLDADIESLSTSVTDVLVNGKLNSYHAEKWLGFGYNSEDVLVPDGWTLIENEIGAGSGRNGHPSHGIWEMVGLSGNGYDAGSMGWRFEAGWSSGGELKPADEVYLSQQVLLKVRGVIGAQVRFMYRVSSSSSLVDQMYVSVRCAGYEIRIHAFEPGDPLNTWIEAVADIPQSVFQNVKNVFKFDIGISSDLSGVQTTTLEDQVFIDTVKLDLDVVPLPEMISLGANQTSIVGGTTGRATPLVPDNEYISGVSSRDCRSWPGVGLQLNGRSANGRLEVGVLNTTTGGWTTTQAGQVGFQFLLDAPQGAIITSAVLEAEGASSAAATRAGMRVYVADEDNVPAFTSGLPVLRSRFDWIPNSIDWYVTGTSRASVRYVSPDLSALVQNVVNRPGWTRGNYMCVMLDYAGSTDYIAYNDAKGSSNYGQEDLAKLVVDFIVPYTEDEVSVFRYRKDLTIDPTKVSSSLTDFPVVIDLFDRELRTHAQQDGRDIKFMIGSVPLNHEIEVFDQNYNSTHARLVCWVRIPTLSSTTDTIVSMYYGSSQANNLQNPLGVWKGYEGVWHLSQSSGSGAYILDSGSRDHDAAPSGSPYLKVGKIDGARYFRGVTGDAVTPFNGEEIFNGWSNWQFSLWIYPNYTSDAEWQSQSDGRVFYKTTSMNLARTYRFSGQSAGEGTFQVDIDFNTAATQYHTVAIRRQSWNYVVYKYESTGSGYLTAYSFVNGVLYDQTSTNIGTGDRLSTDTSPFAHGSYSDVTSKGALDEFRVINNGYKSQAWVETEYRNQNSPATFYSIGQEKMLLVGTNPRLLFSTSSQLPVGLGLAMRLNVTSAASTLNDSLLPGTSFSVANSTLTNWSASVLVSPPAEVKNLSFELDYPYHDWGPVSVTSPSGQTKTTPNDWTTQAGTLTVRSSAIDSQGVWSLKFVQYNSILDAKLGVRGSALGTTATFNIGQEAEVRGWTPWVTGEETRVVLRDPSGSVWYSATNATGGSSAHLMPSLMYRKNIVINHLRVAGTFADFPVCINMYDSDLHNPTKVQLDADDIVFVSNGIVLPHEVELFEQNYNSTMAHLVAWVKANVSSSTDTAITMYYGNPILGSQENPEAVWSNSFAGVWHLAETPTGAAGEITDSSPANNDGSTLGSMSSSDSVTASIGKGLRLDGINDIIMVPKSSVLDDVNDRGTLQLWINWVNAADGGYQRVLTTRNRFPLGGGRNGLEWASQPLGNHYFYPWGGGSYNLGPNPFTNSKWHYLVVTYDYSTKDALIYVDGAPMTLNATYIPTSWTQLATYDDWLWGGNLPDYPESAVAGMFDEIRVSDVARSAQWIQTEYNCQSSPNTFYTVGAESQRPTAEPVFRKTIDSSAPAGLWTASIYYNDTTGNANYRVGNYERSFIVRHGSALALLSPDDAISDGISTRVVGELLLVEVNLTDTINSQHITGAVVSLNWSASGVPSNVFLEDYGTGVYGKSLNTSDLSTSGRWRIGIQAVHQYYSTASNSFYLDLFHTSRITYQSPASTPYGDDFVARLTLRDSPSGALLAGAQITSNGTIVGAPTDYGNGTYRIVLETNGLSVGLHGYEIRANPSQPYLVNCSTTVSFSYRNIATDLSSTGTDPANVAWGRDVNVTLRWRDSDHAQAGITGGAVSGSSIDSWTDIGNGNYSVRIDVSAQGPGVFQFTFQLSRVSYQSASIMVSVNIVPHRTYVMVSYNSSVPLGCNTYFSLVFYDLDAGGTQVPGNFSGVTAQWTGGSSNHASRQFWLQTNSWVVGTYVVNLTVKATSTPRYYYDSLLATQVIIRKLTTSLTWNHFDLVPIGDDLKIVLHVSVIEPYSPYNGNPVNGLTLTHFSAKNAAGSPYTIKGLAAWGSGNYNMTIDASHFSAGGNFTIRVYLTFTAENYLNTQTPTITFTYRSARSQLSSPDYPLAAVAYSTNATVTLNFEDLDRGTGIVTATATATGASIVSTTHVGDGEYRVVLRTSAWSIGDYSVSLTASATDYQNQSIAVTIRVRAVRTYAVPTVTVLEVPVGDSRVFYADYVDMDHSTALSLASGVCNWTGVHYSIAWTGSRYMVTIHTYDTDVLGNYLLMFNFTYGSNYEVGRFNVTVNIRTILTEFRLVAPVEPTTSTGTIFISVYYGDRDHGVGIKSGFVQCIVRNSTGMVSIVWKNGSSMGYYEIQIAASQFGGLGTQHFTVLFNWTGVVQKYENKSLPVSGDIVGEGSALALISAELPSPCLANMSYEFLYSSTSTGSGITNSTQDVFIRVMFVGTSVDLTKIDIWETNRLLKPGHYSIMFNSTILGATGLFSMRVFINWSGDASPFYTNRTDVISVRVLPRSTMLSIVPPTNVPYGENVTFSFSYEDVTGGTPQTIAYDSDHMTINLLPHEYSVYYNSVTRVFTVTTSTSQFGAPLGTRVFTLDVTWSGIPFYGNITGRVVSVTLIPRQTSLTYPTPPTTVYVDNATFVVTWVDVTGAEPEEIANVSVGLYNGASAIPLTHYSIKALGSGKYEVQLRTTYFGSPGQYSLKVRMNSTAFYIEGVEGTRNLAVLYRPTILTADQTGAIPFGMPIEVTLRYQDLSTLQAIANSTGAPIRLTVLNGTGWIFTCTWRASLQDYFLSVVTAGHSLVIGVPYTLRLNFSAPYQSPYYTWASVGVHFLLRNRDTTLELTSAAMPTPYLEYANFTVFFKDLQSGSGITGAVVSIYRGITKLQIGTQYLLTATGDGRYVVSLNSTALIDPGFKTVRVLANWTSGSPYHGNASIDVSVSVTRRPTSVQIVVPPSQTRYLDNMSFSFVFTDLTDNRAITVLTSADINIWANGTLLGLDNYSLSKVGSLFVLVVNSTVLSPRLVNPSNYNLTIKADWNDSAAPYYFDDSETVRVTTTHRLGTVNLGQFATTPMGDNISLALTFLDSSTSAPIQGALVGLFCINKTGLIENVDYWISDDNAGTYTVLVSSSSLGSLGQYIFTLQVGWSPSESPYYSNVTALRMTATVRPVQASLAVGLPIPSIIAFHQNVFLAVNMTDDDRSVPVNGAVGAISVLYKSSMTEPAVWSIRALGGGVYSITVNVTEALEPGPQTFIIKVSLYPYAETQIETTVQVRFRIGLLAAEVQPAVYAGTVTFVIVNLTDFEANDRPLTGAVLNLTWGDSAYWYELGAGLYNVTLVTERLMHGTNALLVGASLPLYDIEPLRLDLNLLSVPSEISIADRTPSELYWGESITVYAAFNDTLRNRLIPSAILTYSWIGGSGILAQSGVLGNYSVTLDTALAPSRTTVEITITGSSPNYINATARVVFRLMPRLFQIMSDRGSAFSVNRRSTAVITVHVQDQLTGSPVTGVALTADWLYGTIAFSEVSGQPGQYTVSISTDQTITYESYTIEVNAVKENYLDASIVFSMSISPILTVVWFDSTTASYEYTMINWSQQVRIGIYVLAIGLNESYPWQTGISACNVTWYSPELAMSGTLMNGTGIGGPGYYYYDFNTTESTATLHTFRIYAKPLSNEFEDSQNSTSLFIKNLPASVISPGSQDVTWGWEGSIDFTYLDVYHGIGIQGADASFYWAGGQGQLVETEIGVYTVLIDSSNVRPGLYRLTASFLKVNYDSIELSLSIRVAPVPTEAVLTIPSFFYVEGSLEDLEIPYGDSLDVVLLYNDSAMGAGIPAAIIEKATFSGPGFFEIPFNLTEMGLGNYSFHFDTTAWFIGDLFTFNVQRTLENRTTATIQFRIQVIEIPANAVVDVQPEVSLFYGMNATVWIYYTDTWEGHTARSIIDASVTIGNTGPQFVDVIYQGEDPLREGWYRFTINAQRITGTAEVTISLNKTYYETRNVHLTVSVSPSESDIIFGQILTYGSAFALILIASAIVWVRVLRVPSQVRKMGRLIKQLKKGRMPKPVTGVKTRQQILTELFNEISKPAGVSRKPGAIPAESVEVKVPQIEELIVELSILTKMSQEELDMFRTEISKMKLSDQTTFAKEVISQEAIRVAKAQGKSVEQILQEVRDERKRRIGGTEGAPIAAPEALEILEEVKEEEVAPEDRLTEEELRIMRAELERRGLPAHEIEAIMSQAKELPRDVSEALLKTFVEKVKHEEPNEAAEAKEFLSETELQDLRQRLEKKKGSSREIESIMAQAKELPRDLAHELLESKAATKKAVKKAPSIDTLSTSELEDLRKELLQKGLPAQEADSIVEQARTVPRNLVGEFLKSVGGKKAPEEEVEFEDRLSDFEVEDLRKKLQERKIPRDEIESIVAQAKSLPKALVEELLKSIDADRP